MYIEKFIMYIKKINRNDENITWQNLSFYEF